MFVISDLKNVWVWANVYEANLDKIHMGDDLDITTLSYPDRVFKGKVDKIMHVLDPNSKVTKVRVVINNPQYYALPDPRCSPASPSPIHNTNRRCMSPRAH